MNQPIRCEPLPFVKTNGEAPAEAPLCTEEAAENGAEFSDLLHAFQLVELLNRGSAQRPESSVEVSFLEQATMERAQTMNQSFLTGAIRYALPEGGIE